MINVFIYIIYLFEKLNRVTVARQRQSVQGVSNKGFAGVNAEDLSHYLLILWQGRQRPVVRELPVLFERHPVPVIFKHPDRVLITDIQNADT